jgi:hypothetical protein
MARVVEWLHNKWNDLDSNPSAKNVKNSNIILHRSKKKNPNILMEAQKTLNS